MNSEVNIPTCPEERAVKVGKLGFTYRLPAKSFVCLEVCVCVKRFLSFHFVCCLSSTNPVSYGIDSVFSPTAHLCAFYRQMSKRLTQF